VPRAHDLLISKYAAGREKDREYARTAVRARLVARELLLERLERTQLDGERRGSIRAQIDADFTDA
jgi:hypothetical protein